MAEVYGLFDPASPCVTFCSKISSEEYEKQSSESTEKAINDLIEYLEYNPIAFYDILNKRKREEEENAGIFSYLKVKLLSMVLGEDYIHITPQEARNKLKEFKNEMVTAYNYGQDAKDSKKRFSKRLADKTKSQCSSTLNKPEICPTSNATKGYLNPTANIPQLCERKDSTKLSNYKNDATKLRIHKSDRPEVLSAIENKELINNNDTGYFTPTWSSKHKMSSHPDIQSLPYLKFPPLSLPIPPHCSTPIPPPPPPPPPPPTPASIVKTKKNTMYLESQIDAEQENPKVRKLVKKRSKSHLKHSSSSGQSMKSKRSGSKMNDLLTCIKDPAVKNNLKPAFPKNTDHSKESPYQCHRKMKHLDENNFPQFNQELINKFRNARSPQASPLMSDCSSADSSVTFSP